MHGANGCFWMDSDDTIDAANGQKLRDLARQEHPDNVLGHVLQVHCPGAGPAGHANMTAVDHVKVVRNLPQVRFEGRIHEQVLPSIRRAGGTVGWTDIFVVHSGSDQSPEGRERKRRRDMRLLELDSADRPEHPFVLFNLGMTYCEMREFDKAADFLERCLHASEGHESHVRKAYALLASSRIGLDQMDAARNVCRAGLRQFPDDPELLFRSGDLAQRGGRLKEAEAAYRRVLEANTARHFTSIDRGIQGFKTRQRLAAVYGQLGQLDRARELWQEVVGEVPQNREAWRSLADILLQQGKSTEAAALADRLLADDAQVVDGLLIQAKVARNGGDLAAARRHLQAAVDRDPDDLQVLQDWCQFAFEHCEPDEAESALRRLIDRCPEDAAAHHNLGTIHLRADRPAEAIPCYQESLRLGPTPRTRTFTLEWRWPARPPRQSNRRLERSASARSGNSTGPGR